MTNETDILATRGAQIQELAIDPAYKDKAIQKIKSLVKGNKCDPESITLKEFDGKILHFRAENIITLISKPRSKEVAGRVDGPTKIANEAAAQEAMNNAYLALAGDPDTEKKITGIILNRKDKGFGIDNVYLDLPFLTKEFVSYKQCATCRATGKVMCLPCNGKGRDLCKHCKGTRLAHCTHCHGARQINGPDGQKINCPICHAQGKVGCKKCRETGYIPCKVCASRGETTCPTCQGSAWSSMVYTMEIKARTQFDYPKEVLPEKVALMIEETGAEISEYAEIKVCEDPVSINQWHDAEKKRQQDVAETRNDISIPILYEVTLPYGHMEYDINDKGYYTFLFGHQAALTHVSPFLDDLIVNGIRKLEDAAELRGDVHDNIMAAGEYRSVKEGIIFAASSSLGKAKKQLKAGNSLGLSDEAIKEIITLSDRALKNMTKKPRLVGLGVAAALYLFMFGIYFLTPIRNMITDNIGNSLLHPVLDFIMFGAVTYIGVTVIQQVAQSAITKTMKTLIPKGIKTAGAKLGKTAIWNIIIAGGLSLLILEATKHVPGGSIPHWYTQVTGMIF